LEDGPGREASRTLADAGVNIEAICAPEAVGKGKVRLLVGDALRAQAVLKESRATRGAHQHLSGGG